MKLLFMLSLMLTILSASTRLNVSFQPAEGKNGYMGTADIKYVIKNCYGDPNLIVNIKTKNTKYRYENKLYDLNQYPTSKTTAKGYTVLEGNIYKSNFDLGHIEYKNITNFNAAGCFSDTYSLTKHLGLDKEYAKEDTIKFLKLLYPVLYINSRDYNLEKEIKKGLSQKSAVPSTVGTASVQKNNSYDNQKQSNTARQQQQKERQFQEQRERERRAQEQRRLDEQRRYAQEQRYTQQQIENQRQSDAIQDKMRRDAQIEQEKREARQREADRYSRAQKANEEQLANDLSGLATSYANAGGEIPEPLGWAAVAALFGLAAVYVLPNDTGTNVDYEYAYFGSTVAVIGVGAAFASQFLDFGFDTSHTITISKSEHSIENNEYYFLTLPDGGFTSQSLNGKFSGFTVSSANYWDLAGVNSNKTFRGLTVWVDYYHQQSDDPVNYRVNNNDNLFYFSSEVTQGISGGLGLWAKFNNGVILAGGAMLADVRLYDQHAVTSIIGTPIELETTNGNGENGIGIPLRAELSYKYFTLTSTYNYSQETLAFGLGLHY